jgi:hypothetical protein
MGTLPMLILLGRFAQQLFETSFKEEVWVIVDQSKFLRVRAVTPRQKTISNPKNLIPPSGCCPWLAAK